MARVRMIKPETFDDPDLNAIPPLARWLFVGLWTLADKSGRLEDDPRRLKVRLLPYDDANCDHLLNILAPTFITRYAVDGVNYLEINNFPKHQRPHPKEPESQIPAPSRGKTRRAVERNGKARKETANPPESYTDTDTESYTDTDTASVHGCAMTVAVADDGFETFWTAYPKKIGKGAARAWWAKHRPPADQTALMVASLARQRLTSQWLRDGGRYIPNPATWLNQQRWDDDPEPDVPQLSDKSVASLRATREFLGADDDRS